MCLYPRLIINRKYTKTKKNDGNIPPIKDHRVKYVPIGCQKCIECTKKKSREWQTRLQEHIKTNTNGKFITLTFSNKEYEILNREIDNNVQGYQRDNEIATLATRRFLERWRKRYKRSIQHWLVTELGHKGTENIHIHGILWTDENYNTIRKYWKYGHIWPTEKQNIRTYVNATTINYLIKYVSKQDHDHKTYKPKVLCSPGIGQAYTKTYQSKTNNYNGQKTNESFRTSTGHLVALPIYWRNKIYTEEEREQLWLQKLDKQERWIMGVKIKVHNKEGIENYFNTLKHYRRLNNELGYGTDQKDWNQEKYERDKRILMQKTRIAKAKAGTTVPTPRSNKRQIITIQ